MDKSKKFKLIFIVVDLVLAVACCFAVRTILRIQDAMRLEIHFASSHVDTRNIAQLYYINDGEKFSSNSVMTEVFEDNVVTFDISEIDFSTNVLRLDPFNLKTNFTISEIVLKYCGHEMFSVKGKEIKNYINKTKSIRKKYKDKGMVCKSKDDNPRIIFNKRLSDKIYTYYFVINRISYFVLIILIIIIGMIQIIILREPDKIKISFRSNIWFVGSVLFLLLSVTITYIVYYFENHFGQVPIGQLIYHLHTPLDGTDMSSYKDDIIKGLLILAGVVSFVVIIWFYLRRKYAQQGFVLLVYMVSVILIYNALYRGITHYEVVKYYKYTHEKTSLYEDNYVDGRDISIVFPEEKRNLIYIFVESMETTFADMNSGGCLEKSIIPNLTELNSEGICFGSEGLLNGAHHVTGATYTMGALAAQTAGVPINENLVSDDTLNGDWDSENNYLPGVWTIGDILNENGYNQELLIGSKGTFAGRSSYFRGHGNYQIEDYDAVKEQGRLASDYKVWWGFEDEKLFEFAKEDALSLSKEDKPFNLTLLTVDTHATGGYKCELCEDEFDEQYSNVIACSDRQVADFVKWVQEQDFYENTTIVLCGDHLTPDSMYIGNIGAAGYDRKTYTAIINPEIDGVVVSKADYADARNYTTLDMYPTTLAAMGVKIEGNKLGLGVNLFSNEQTLAEKYGLEYLNTELMKNSDLYTKKLLYK